MKWWLALLMAIVLTLIFGLPFREYETQQLLPIKTLQAEYTQNGIHIVSNVGEGKGESWQAAVEDLRKNASGDVFFDTAEQLAVTDRRIAFEAANSHELRPSAQVYLMSELAPMEGLYEFLKAHPSEEQISDYHMEER
ncbi:MAG: hypothetical protein E7434_02740 [Ruminococcaceae bacterium]|nr:hypothetical protein [Oscillospiraceae bacterium]